MKDQHSLRNLNYSQDLRSEKIRNIVGPMPPNLTQYGIITIFLTLAIIITVSAFLPFRKIVSGIIYINDISLSMSDSVLVKAQLKFHQSNPINPENCRIVCYGLGGEAKGIVSCYTPLKTEHGEYGCELKFSPNTDLECFKNIETDFTIIVSETSVLNRLLSVFRMKK